MPASGPWATPGLTLPDPAIFMAGTVELARTLLGMVLATDLPDGPTAGVIVETEAYTGLADRGCHAFGGRQTPRLASLWGPAGRAYIFAIHSRWCFDITVGPPGTPECVLVRAVEPLWGLETMVVRRGMDLAAVRNRDPREAPKKLTSGPAVMCQALGIDGSLDGHDLSQPPLRLFRFAEPAATPPPAPLAAPPVAARARPAVPAAYEIAAGPRVGIAYAGADADLPFRFWIQGNRFVSTPSSQVGIGGRRG